MKTGLAMLLGLALAGGLVGVRVGRWFLEENVREPTLEEPLYLGVGGILGTAGGLAVGLGIAYAIGRRER